MPTNDRPSQPDQSFASSYPPETNPLANRSAALGCRSFSTTRTRTRCLHRPSFCRIRSAQSGHGWTNFRRGAFNSNGIAFSGHSFTVPLRMPFEKSFTSSFTAFSGIETLKLICFRLAICLINPANSSTSDLRAPFLNESCQSKYETAFSM
ncbi:MAG: hypothetical protein GF353_16885 [Candidatus Lokiarchaeota archaeon]|nr:hypothetical protein [Candidatus Lokiarchaeota archaeon]